MWVLFLQAVTSCIGNEAVLAAFVDGLAKLAEGTEGYTSHYSLHTAKF